MAFCKNCGLQMDDTVKFCMSCGTPAAPQAVAAPQTVQQEYQPPVQEYTPPAPQTVQQEYRPMVQEYTPPQAQPVQQTYVSPQAHPVQQTYTPPQTQSGQQSYVPPAQAYQAPAAGGQPKKGKAILAYLAILVLIPIFTAKDDLYTRFHANQGLVIFIINILINGISQSTANMVSEMSFVPALIVSGLLGLLGIFFFVLNIIGIINAATGKMKPLPLIGGIKLLK